MQECVRGERGGWREQQHMVVMGIKHRGNGEESIATRAVLDDNWLSPLRSKLVGQQPGGDINARTRAKRNDKANRALRPLIGRLRLRERRRQNRGCYTEGNKEQEIAQTLHGDSRQ